MKSAGDAGGASAAVGFQHVAIERDRALADRVEIDDRPQAAADQPLNLRRAAIDFPVAIAALARRRAARHHVVFGRQPAATLARHPLRQLGVDAGGAKHGRAAGLNQHAARRGPREMPRDVNGAELVGLAIVETHEEGVRG